MANQTEIVQQINLAAAAQQGHEIDSPTFQYTQGAMDALRWVTGDRGAPFDDGSAPVLNDKQFTPEGEEIAPVE